MQGPGATYELGRDLKRLGLVGPVLLIAGGTAQRELQPIGNQVLPAAVKPPIRPAPWPMTSTCRRSSPPRASTNSPCSGRGLPSTTGTALARAVHNGIPAIPASHRFIHGEKVAISLLTQLVLEGRFQAEIEEFYRN